MTSADALLFDLGGVLLRIDWQRAFESWARSAACTPADIAARFHFDEAYCAHERGEIDAAEYFSVLRGMLGIAVTDAQFLAGWNAIFAGEVAGVRSLLATAAARHPLYLFSNTCAVHRDHWQPRFAALLRPFAGIFLSCEIGMRKPELRAFEYVAHAIGVPPGRIAFFDDTAENVAGAERAGLRAFHIGAAGDLAAALDASV